MKTLTALSVQFSVLLTLERHDFYVVHNLQEKGWAPGNGRRLLYDIYASGHVD